MSEIHSFWENNTQLENWIITKYKAMPLQWNIKFLTDELWFIMMGVALLMYVPNRINRTTAAAFTLFCVADMLMYIWNYKEEGYGAMYTFLLIAWILIYNHGSKRTTDRPRVSY